MIQSSGRGTAIARRAVRWLAAVVLLVAACVPSGPERASREWMAAFAASDTARLTQMTCSAQQGAARNAGSVLSEIVNFTQTIGGYQLGVDQLTYRTIRGGAESADVRVYGPMRVTTLLMSFQKEVDFTVHLQQEADQWRYCGVNILLPSAEPAGRGLLADWFGGGPSAWLRAWFGAWLAGWVAPVAGVALVLVGVIATAAWFLRRPPRVGTPHFQPPVVRPTASSARPSPRPGTASRTRPRGWL